MKNSCQRSEPNMNNKPFYFSSPEKISRYVNQWDLALLVFIFLILFFLAWAGQQMTTPYELGEPLAISLSPEKLPFYALRTVTRLFAALILSLLFTFVVGALAAKNRRAETVIIPAIDILQSIPVLSFLSITVMGFIQLFPNSLLGPECASIFAIFTSQVWNMTFGFYQSLKMLPDDLKEASAMFQLSAWQRFWKVEVPFSMSGLLWNMMISMSASWFFVVLSEVISVSHQNIRLPGVGSYIAVAIGQHDLRAVGYAILTMAIVIIIYDQILFRPLIAWSEKFKLEYSPDEQEYQSWLIDFIRRSQLMKQVGYQLSKFKAWFINPQWATRRSPKPRYVMNLERKKKLDWFWGSVLTLMMLSGGAFLLQFILASLNFYAILRVVWLGAVTGIRVISLIIF